MTPHLLHAKHLFEIQGLTVRIGTDGPPKYASSSPFTVTRMAIEEGVPTVVLDPKGSPDEFYHEVGHLVAWINGEKPAGNNWGFEVENGAIDRHEVIACRVEAYLIHANQDMERLWHTQHVLDTENFGEDLGFERNVPQAREAFMEKFIALGRKHFCAVFPAAVAVRPKENA